MVNQMILQQQKVTTGGAQPDVHSQTSDTHFLSLCRREVAVCFSPMSMCSLDQESNAYPTVLAWHVLI